MHPISSGEIRINGESISQKRLPILLTAASPMYRPKGMASGR